MGGLLASTTVADVRLVVTTVADELLVVITVADGLLASTLVDVYDGRTSIDGVGDSTACALSRSKTADRFAPVSIIAR